MMLKKESYISELWHHHKKWFADSAKRTWFWEKIEDNYRTKVQDFTRWVHWKDRRVRRSWKGVPHWLGTSGARFTHSPSPHHHCSQGYKQPLWVFSLSFQFRWMQAVFCIWGPCGFTIFWFSTIYSAGNNILYVPLWNMLFKIFLSIPQTVLFLYL